MHSWLPIIVLGLIFGGSFGAVFFILKCIFGDGCSYVVPVEQLWLHREYAELTKKVGKYEKAEYKLAKMREIAETWGMTPKESEKMYNSLFGGNGNE